jgi:hypothetical protein
MADSVLGRIAGISAGRSLNQGNHVTKARVFSRLKPFEDYHLRGHDLGAIPLHSPDRGFLAFWTTRADRVAHDVDAPTCAQQPHHGLKHADMGFAS